MLSTVRCLHCGRDVPRPSSPTARCPACHAALAGPPGPATPQGAAGTPPGPARWAQTEIGPGELPVPAGGYEDLELGPEADAPVAPRPPLRSDPAATDGPPPLRTRSQSSLAAARMANAPTFKGTGNRGGIPLLPIGIGVVVILAVAAFALTRGRPAAPLAEPRVATTVRPPAPITPPVAEPVPAPPPVTVDPPVDRAPPPRERPRNAEREPPARTAHPAPPTTREVARAERAAAAARLPPAPAPAPRAEPEPPLPPPPQFVAAPAPPPPAAPAPQASGPGQTREGYQKARQATPGCVVNSLRLPRDIADVGGESATVKFAVDETGQVSQFSYLTGPTDQRIATAIWSAVQRCEWIPGSTAQGNRIMLWVTMPIRFGK